MGLAPIGRPAGLPVGRLAPTGCAPASPLAQPARERRQCSGARFRPGYGIPLGSFVVMVRELVVNHMPMSGIAGYMPLFSTFYVCPLRLTMFFLSTAPTP
uniref:Uncharacterized protein n=1 Tax=Angiostrongylus cantonensis TaxID=6313 RepID=A0A0K0DFE3_ANGCA